MMKPFSVPRGVVDMLTVAFGSFCLMVIELIAGRIMAPTLGVSIYTWTSIIAVILAGITLGNAAGGMVADRAGSRSTLGKIFIVSGLATLMIVYTGRTMDRYFAGSMESLLFSTLYYSIMVFLPPAFFLSFVTPMVVKLALTDLAKTGTTVGRLYASSAAGSILGTVMTGYFFIEWFGTTAIANGIALSLVVVGLLHLGNVQLLKSRSFPLVLLLFLGSWALPSSCTRESQYYCIIIKPWELPGGSTGSIVRLDHLVYSFLLPDDRTGVAMLGYSYERAFAQLVAMEQTTADPFRAFYIGGGGYVGPRYFTAVYPNSDNTVSEIDPVVTQVNKDLLSLPTSERLRTVNQDARIALKQMSPETKYDYIFGDAFNDFAVPYHLTTREFNQLVKAHLTPDGWYALNVIDDPRSGRFVSSIVKTLEQDFSNVTLMPDPSQAPINHRTTFVVLASDAALDRERWNKAKLPVEIPDMVANTTTGTSSETMMLSDPKGLNAWIAQKNAIVLTDNFVPVDTMVAPLFTRR
ncbi:fused MFS/spermidine synthase [Candidatus Uhrbacteria bacterium]|nr:fused MFS/spermidine synthase [Candidatus Uhrbacteria bacterium]